MNLRFPPAANGAPRHWHITRDIKPRGECPACDAAWAEYDEKDRHATKISGTQNGHPPPEQGDRG